jgi:ATP-dependent DNA helicase RecG
MLTDAMTAAELALEGIGDGWVAGREERELLDFKETPETAIPADRRAGRNMGRERKAFLGLLAESAMCLANARGGVIVVGVRDRAATRVGALQGVDAAYSVEALRLAVHRGTVPPLTVEAVERTVDDKRLVLVRVPQGAVVHATSGGTYKWRVGDQCLPIEATEMRAIQAARGQYDWSEDASAFGLDGLSAAALANAAERLRAIGRDELARLAEDDREQFLRSCDLLVDGRLRRAAVLLYGSEHALSSLVADWGVILTSAESPGSEGSVLMRREDAARRPIVLLIDEILARIAALASVETIRVGASEVRLVDYDADVARELVANAFAHRDWEQPGIIEIAHSPDELVISSPGDLLPTLHPDRLLRETAQRNGTLAREIARLRIAEGAGLGFDRVWRVLASTGKEAPRIEPGPRFTVVVGGGRGDQAFARFIRSPEFPEPRLGNDLDVLLALSALRHRRSLSAPVLAPVLQRDERSTQRVLERMADAGLVEATRSSRRRQAPTYRLTQSTLAGLRTALTYRTETIDSDDAKLLRHLKRHRRIANEDVRSYLNCGVATARNRLTRLRAMGWIDFAPGGPRRGPSVEYVATDLVDRLQAPS